jgi:hypothetical protein
MRQLVDHAGKHDGYRRISQQTYEAMGGVIGSLQKSADAVYADFDEAQKAAMQNIMLRMVALAGGETAGKRVMRSALDFGNSETNRYMQQVINALENDHRLLHSGTDSNGDRYLEPAHDALVRSWSKVQEWVKAVGRENLLVCEQLTEAVNEKLKKENAALWSDDPRTEICNQLYDSKKYVFTTRETQFLKASEQLRLKRIQELQDERDKALASEKVAQDERQKAEAAAREAIMQQQMARTSERKAVQRRNIAVIGFVLACTLVFVSGYFSKRMKDERERADKEKELAQKHLSTAIENRIKGEATKVDQGLIDAEIFLYAAKDSLALNKVKFLKKELKNIKHDFPNDSSKIDTFALFRKAWNDVLQKEEELSKNKI